MGAWGWPFIPNMLPTCLSWAGCEVTQGQLGVGVAVSLLGHHDLPTPGVVRKGYGTLWDPPSPKDGWNWGGRFGRELCSQTARGFSPWAREDSGLPDGLGQSLTPGITQTEALGP